MTTMNLAEIRRWFEDEGRTFEGLSGFRKEWMALTEKDKADIRDGLENGTLTY